MADSVAAVVVTYDALPWIEPCLESLAGGDRGRRSRLYATARSSVVRDRFPAFVLVEQENLGLGAGWNRGHGRAAATSC